MIYKISFDSIKTFDIQFAAVIMQFSPAESKKGILFYSTKQLYT